MDGTLLDTLEDLTDAVNYTLAHYGYPARSDRDVRKFVGNGIRNLVRRSFPVTLPEQILDEATEFYRTYYNAHSQVKTRPYDGISEMLEAVRKNHPVGVVSNKPDEPVKALCRNFFGDMYALGERADTPRKPAPDMLLKAMADLGVEKCVFVGDGETDVVTARNAGAVCISVLWGFRDREELEAEGSRNFCDDPRQLAQLIETLLAGGV